MELDGVKRCFSFLFVAGLKIPIFITDRHKGICKWIREQQKDTAHFYDLWHVCKSLVKDLLSDTGYLFNAAIEHEFSNRRSDLPATSIFSAILQVFRTALIALTPRNTVKT